jgi:hypothetical protein
MTDLRVHDHRSGRSRWADLRVHDRPIWVFTIGRNPHDFASSAKMWSLDTMKPCRAATSLQERTWSSILSGRWLSEE